MASVGEEGVLSCPGLFFSVLFCSVLFFSSVRLLARCIRNLFCFSQVDSVILFLCPLYLKTLYNDERKKGNGNLLERPRTRLPDELAIPRRRDAVRNLQRTDTEHDVRIQRCNRESGT